MRHLTLLLLALLALPAAAAADEPLALLERVALTARDAQPGLERTQATIRTSKLGEMLGKMTANMPPDMPRPQAPVLRKYWTRAGGTLIRAEGEQAFPYMQEMVQRISADLAIDLRTLFLPADRAADRRALAATASTALAETRVGGTRLVTVGIAFAQPADLNGAFYGSGLDLPQTGIDSLEFDLDPAAGLLRRLEIVPAEGLPLAVEIRHLAIAQGALPYEVQVATPDGSLHETLQTTFVSVDGFQLPSFQERKMHYPGHEEEIEVEFLDYRVNQPFPDEVEKAFAK